VTAFGYLAWYLASKVSTALSASLRRGAIHTRTVTLTCTWSAAGALGRYRADDQDSDDAVDGNQFGGFTTAGGEDDNRQAGYVGAFADCKVE